MSPFHPRRSALTRRTPCLVPAIAVLLAIGLATGSAMAQSASERLIDEWASAARTAGRTVEWSARTAAPDEDRLELRDLTISLPGEAATPSRLTAPRVVVVGLAARSGGGGSLARLEIPRLSLTTALDGETATYDLTDLTLTDVAVPPIERPTIDPDRPVTSALAATRVLDPLAVGRATVGTLAVDAGSPDGSARTQVTVEGLELDGLSGGRLRRFAVGRFVMDVTAEVGRALLSASSVELLGFDPTAWRRVLADEPTEAVAPVGEWLTSTESFRTGRLTLESDTGRLSIEALRAGPRRVRRTDVPIGAMLDRLVVAGGVPRLDVTRLLLEIWSATRNDGWTLEGFHLSGPDLEHADVARVVVGSVSSERLEEATIEGLDVVGGRAIARVGRLAAPKLGVPDVDDLRRAIQAAVVGAEIDPSSLIPRLDHLALERLELAEPDVPALRLDAFRLDLGHHLRAVPTEVSAVIEHLVVPAGLAEATGRRLLAGLGYDRIDVSAAVHLAWNEARRDLSVEKTELAIADMGRLDLTARLTGVPPALFLRPETAAEVVDGIGLAEATATFTDASIVERSIATVARDEKSTPARVRRGVVREVTALLAVVRDPTRRRRMGEELRRFLAAPKSITVELRPPRPLPIVDVFSTGSDLSGLAERLDARLRAER